MPLDFGPFFWRRRGQYAVPAAAAVHRCGRICEPARPMTDDQPRLYYDDPYMREFDATVTRVEEREIRSAIWLDRTAFYPT